VALLRSRTHVAVAEAVRPVSNASGFAGSYITVYWVGSDQDKLAFISQDFSPIRGFGGCRDATLVRLVHDEYVHLGTSLECPTAESFSIARAKDKKAA
jgi:hypothetical protein